MGISVKSGLHGPITMTIMGKNISTAYQKNNNSKIILDSVF